MQDLFSLGIATEASASVFGVQMELLVVRSHMHHVEKTAHHWQEEKQQVHCSTQQLQGLVKKLLCQLKVLKGAKTTTIQQHHEAVGDCGLDEEKALEVSVKF